ncbi:hypothetical protein TIFTF001_053661 [Ficus carica]|uniref:Uncharacterized protein n=1 Tax=Ficus carica TaxID=3494 RepID=A0AA88EEB4_FICCA|nr:hypothetical protein TIFTF001_053661 [Ficus carica]
MVGDGEERERESVWATQGEREAVDGLGEGEEREREAVGGLDDGEERERERPWARPKEREREKFAWPRQGEREKKLRERMEIAKIKLDIALMKIGKPTKAK